MRLRTQLTLAFSFLAVVPLAALTLYSYSSSIRAYRQAVADEAASRAEEMRGRMAMMQSDLDRRIDQARVLPLFELGGFGITIDSTRADQAYAGLVRALGPVAPLLERLAIRQESAATSLPADGESGHAGGADSVFIYLPGMASLARIEARESLMQAGSGEGVAADTTHRFVVIGRHLVPRVATLAGFLGDFHTGEIESIAGAMSREAGDAARIAELSVRMGAEILRRRHGVGRAAKTTPQSPSGLQESRPRASQAGVAFDYPVRDQGRVRGTLRAELNVPAVMGRILRLSTLKEGETPFAIDSQGLIYASSDSEKALLESIGLTPGPDSGVASANGEWVVVSSQDTASSLTFGIARPLGAGLARIRQTAARNLGLGLAVIALAMVGVVQLSRRMTTNLSALTMGARRLATGDLDHRVPVKSKDEFGTLARAFNAMADQLVEHQHRLVEQERLERELELCRQIQSEMLPKAPLCLPFAEIRGVSVPARQVGGDFFNFFPLPDGTVTVLVGDVSGKGVAAALLMANMQATLSARLPLAESLADLAAHLDEEIHLSTPPGTFLTLFIGLIDHRSMTLRWLNAGHDAPYILHASGDLLSLPPTGRPLGLLPGGGFREEVVEIRPQDTLFLYTDGVVEAFDADGEEFGATRLEEILRRAGGTSLERILSEVEAAVRTHRGHTEAHDDTTMVAVKMV